MRESFFVAGFVLTREDLDALGSDGRELLMNAITRSDGVPRKPLAARGSRPTKRELPLPLPPPRR